MASNSDRSFDPNSTPGRMGVCPTTVCRLPGRGFFFPEITRPGNFGVWEVYFGSKFGRRCAGFLAEAFFPTNNTYLDFQTNLCDLLIFQTSTNTRKLTRGRVH